MDVKFDNALAALASLEAALQLPPRNDLERDGTIQRFEYTFEAFWKVAKRVLNAMGLPSASPRAVIRDLAQAGFIDDPRLWMSFLEARNYTSHAYDAATAVWVFSKCAPFAAEARTLLGKLQQEAQG